MKCAITRSNGQSSTTYKEKPDFFSRTLELFSSSTRGPSYDIVTQGVTEDDRVELPFEFTWPERTEIAPGSKWTPSPYHEHQEGGLLPPTYARYSSNEQLVEYFLEARLYTGSAYHPEHEVRCPLVYRPSPPILDPIPLLPRTHNTYSSRGIVTRTHRLHPDYDPNEGWRARLRHSWSKDKDTTPFANYRVNVSCPSVVTSGKSITVTLSLEHLERSKDIPDTPPVHLRRISVRISSKLHVRIPSRSLFGSSDMTDTHSDKHVLLDKSFNMGEGLLMYDGMPATTAQFPTDITPAFQTYGLALTQVMKVELWGECAREKFRFIPVEGDVSIVPDSTPQVDRPLTPPPPIDAKVAGTTDDAPPAVGEDTAPPPYQVLDKN
ncbi:hypothetical protein N0V90_012244 [Kalmusia sp. IMI 367209]|nr:hypothetical protein N0V90_012244 [Kalmusia sp. IMI 367209]